MPLPVRSGNPGLNEKTFSDLPRASLAEGRMTLNGTINKSFLMLVVLLATALFTWSQFLESNGDPASVSTWMLVGLIGGLITALIISFKMTAAPYLALPYAALEGLAIGGISAMFERRFPGIAIQAVALTFGVLAVLLIAFRAGVIRVTQTFRSIVVGATGAIALVYIVSMVLGFFHVNTPFLYDSSPLSIGISLFVVGIAALNLVLDFDMIQTGVSQGAPKYMEWYSAFGLLVTLIWLYLEILRLLGKMRDSSR